MFVFTVPFFIVILKWSYLLNEKTTFSLALFWLLKISCSIVIVLRVQFCSVECWHYGIWTITSSEGWMVWVEQFGSTVLQRQSESLDCKLHSMEHSWECYTNKIFFKVQYFVFGYACSCVKPMHMNKREC